MLFECIPGTMVVEVLSKSFVEKLKPSDPYLLLQIHTKMLNDNRSQRFDNGTLGFSCAAASPPTS